MMSKSHRFILATRIRLKNFYIFGNERQLYRNTEETDVCPYKTVGNRPPTSICNEKLEIPVENGNNIDNVTIEVHSHKNDTHYQVDPNNPNKRAILTICEVEIYAGKTVHYWLICGPCSDLLYSLSLLYIGWCYRWILRYIM